MYHVMSSQHASEVIGVFELVIAALIVVRRRFPTISGIGSLAGSAMFLITLSFLFTTPKVKADAGFLLKDLILLGGCLFTAGEALLMGQVVRRSVTRISSDLEEPC
jgi:uncharacterized membrane protein YkgB